MVEQALERKAMLYNKMVNGEIEADEDCLVNFDEKVKRKATEESVLPKKVFSNKYLLLNNIETQASTCINRRQTWEITLG